MWKNVKMIKIVCYKTNNYKSIKQWNIQKLAMKQLSIYREMLILYVVKTAIE